MLRRLGLQRLEPGQMVALFALTALAARGWMAWLLARGRRMWS